MISLSATEIQDALAVYGYSASAEYSEKVRRYIETLLRWNAKVALTSVTEPREVLKFHFGESLFGMRAGDVENCRLADFGSGAGFPGIPISMADAEIRATLIEANGKKAAFLAEIQRELALPNVAVYKARAEDLPPGERFDVVVARAVGDHLGLLRWSAKRLTRGGKVVLWLSRSASDQIRAVLGWKWQDPVKIPNTRNRSVAVASIEF